MIPMRVMLVETKADKKRAAIVRSAEENFVRKPTPSFFTDGRGLCRTEGDPDDYAETSRKPAGYKARQRAAIVCRACPFVSECLAWAKESGQSGVFGGSFVMKGEVIGDAA